MNIMTASFLPHDIALQKTSTFWMRFGFRVRRSSIFSKSFLNIASKTASKKGCLGGSLGARLRSAFASRFMAGRLPLSRKTVKASKLNLGSTARANWTVGLLSKDSQGGFAGIFEDTSGEEGLTEAAGGARFGGKKKCGVGQFEKFEILIQKIHTTKAIDTPQ
jgi:hypothetical protein